MSKEYYCFENEKGDTGFLAGVVDVLSDNLSMLCDFRYTFDADIFHLENNDFSKLNDVIKKRLHYYNKRYGVNLPEEDIDNLDFILKKFDTDSDDTKKYLCSVFSEYSTKKDIYISEKVNGFFNDLNWHLQKPISIYTPLRLPDKNINVLGHIYLYMAFYYFFVSYDEWIVLFVFGTVE